MNNIALLGDTSTHGGALTTTNQDGRLLTAGIAVCANGCTLACPIHGNRIVTAITTRSFVNGRLIVTAGAIASCGAVITPPDRGVYVE